MTTPRRVLAQSTRMFGRRGPALAKDAARVAPRTLSNDAQLFALTFTGGFLFVSVFLG